SPVLRADLQISTEDLDIAQVGVDVRQRGLVRRLGDRRLEELSHLVDVVPREIGEEVGDPGTLGAWWRGRPQLVGERSRANSVARLEAELGRRDATAPLRLWVGGGGGGSSHVGQLGP